MSSELANSDSDEALNMDSFGNEYPYVFVDDVCSVGDGAHSKVNRVSNGVPYLTSKNIGQGELKLNSYDCISTEDYERLFPKNSKATRRPMAGDVLIGIIGTIGNAYLYKDNDYFGFASSIGILRPNHKILFPGFLYYAITTSKFKNIHSNYNAGSVQGYTNIPTIKKLKLPLPPLNEQKKIAALLTSLDDRITLLREANTTLESIAQALFKSWFVDFDPVRAKMEGREPEGAVQGGTSDAGGRMPGVTLDADTAALFPDSFEESELGLVPKGWRVANIGKIANIIDCLHAKKPALFDEGRPFLQLNNIRDDALLDISELAYISDSEYKKWTSRIEVANGDCVITNVGRVGAVAQIPNGFKAAMGRNMTAIRLLPEWPYPTYLVELLQSPWMKAEIATKMDFGTILNALNVKNIPLLRCVLAPHNLLQAFEDVARPLRYSMEENIGRIHTLSNLRDTLLPRLISGQLRLPEAEDLLETT